LARLSVSQLMKKDSVCCCQSFS